MSSSSSFSSSFWTNELEAIAAALVGGVQYGVKIRFPHALVMTFLFRRNLTPTQKMQAVIRMTKEHATNLATFATVYKVVLLVLKVAARAASMGGVEESSRFTGLMKSMGKILLSMIVARPSDLTTTTQTVTKLSIQESLSLPGYPERPWHALIAGATGGYLVWGKYSSVNHQIILYLTSRVLVGVTRFGWEQWYNNNTNGSSGTYQQSRLLNHPSTYPLVAATLWGLVMALFEHSPHVLHRSLKQSMSEIYRFQLPRHNSKPSHPDALL